MTGVNYSTTVASGVTDIYIGKFAPSGTAPETGIQFLENGTTGSNIRLVWDGANLLPRDDHTSIWVVQHFQQTGYHGSVWHSSNTGLWFNGSGPFVAGNTHYGFNCSPYPNQDGLTNGAGQPLNIIGGAGTIHYQSIAGVIPHDRIQYPDGPFIIVPDVWITQARTCHTDGLDLVHRFYPDVYGAPNEYIELIGTVAGVHQDNPPNPAYYKGASDWTNTGTGAGSTNTECPYGIWRGFRDFDVALVWADISSEANAIGNGHTAVTSAGIANPWYMNDNPTVADTADKSGQGHNPTWANANRPSDWAA